MNLEFDSCHKAEYKGWTVHKNPVSGIVTIRKPLDNPIVFPDRPAYCNITHDVRRFAMYGNPLNYAIDYIDNA